VGWTATPRVLALSAVYFCTVTPFHGLSFFLPQIVKDFGLTNVEAGFVTAIPYVIGAISMVHWGRRVVMQGGTLAEYFAAGEPCKRARVWA
jgi:nitrate/nitrite transporter NarK